ncbi:MAG: glycosyltransferase family 4 protein [Rikenellaceae bacterium]
MINVLYIAHEDGDVMGGSAKSLYNMINALKEDVEPIVAFPVRCKIQDYFISKGIRCITLPYRSNITSRGTFGSVIRFIPRYVRDFIARRKANSMAERMLSLAKIDIIHTNTSIIDWGAQFAKKHHIAHVWHLREFQDLDFGFRPYLGWGILLSMIHSSEATISITAVIKRHFKLDDRDGAYQFYNAVRSVKDITYSGVKAPYFMLCGNLTEAKGVKLAIESFAQFSQKIDGYRLLLIGKIDPRYREELVRRAADLKVGDRVEFLPYAEDIDRYYQEAAGYLMCSPNEAMGRVTVEALFNGCPVIGYNSGGTKEIIEHGATGLLFTTAQECADAMVAVLDSDMAMRLAKNGHALVRDSFSEEAYRGSILKVYNDIKEDK